MITMFLVLKIISGNHPYKNRVCFNFHVSGAILCRFRYVDLEGGMLILGICNSTTQSQVNEKGHYICILKSIKSSRFLFCVTIN